MNQSKLGSFIEAVVGTAIGLVISMIVNQIIFPRFGFHPTFGENILISCIYTGISIARGYALRRWFNARLHRAAQRMAERLS